MGPNPGELNHSPTSPRPSEALLWPRLDSDPRRFRPTASYTNPRDVTPHFHAPSRSRTGVGSTHARLRQGQAAAETTIDLVAHRPGPFAGGLLRARKEL